MSFFKRRQFCFELNTLIIVEINEIVNEQLCLLNGIGSMPAQAFGFQYSKEVFSHSIIITVSPP